MHQEGGKIGTPPEPIKIGPLSWSQHPFFLLSYWSTSDPPWPNVVRLCLITPSRPVGDLRDALAALSQRHEILRTRVAVGERGEAEQTVFRPLAPEEIPLTPIEGSYDHRELLALRSRLRRTGHGADGFPWSAYLIRSTSGEQVVIISVQHVLTDAAGIDVLKRDLGELLDTSSGRPDRAAGTQVSQQLDQVAWERSAAGEVAAERALSYIGELLDRAPQRLFSGPYEVAEETRCIEVIHRSAAALTALDRTCAHYGANRSSMLMALLGALLSVRTDQTLCPLRAYFENRVTPELQRSAGCFQQPAFMLLDVAGDPSFSELLSRMGKALFRAYARARYPDDRMREMVVRRSFHRGVYTRFLFDINFIGESRPATATSAPVTGAPLWSLGATERNTYSGGSPELCEFMACVEGDVLGLSLDVDGAFVGSADVELILHGVVRALEYLSQGKDPTIGRLAGEVGVHPRRRPDGWVRARGCWTDIHALAAALRRHPDVETAFVTQRETRDNRLVAYVSSSSAELTPFDLHEHLLARLAAEPCLVCPDLYLICAAAQDPGDNDEVWESQPVLAQGSGRDIPFRSATSDEERALTSAFRQTHDLSAAPNLAETYVQAGGRVARIPAFVQAVGERGYSGLAKEDFLVPVTLRKMAEQLRRAG
jgi:hypothetical protein